MVTIFWPNLVALVLGEIVTWCGGFLAGCRGDSTGLIFRRSACCPRCSLQLGPLAKTEALQLRRSLRRFLLDIWALP